MWAVSARITTHGKDSAGKWTGTREVPTFYLDDHVQMFTDEAGAVNVASAVINPLGTIPADDIHVSAVKL